MLAKFETIEKRLAKYQWLKQWREASSDNSVELEICGDGNLDKGPCVSVNNLLTEAPKWEKAGMSGRLDVPFLPALDTLDKTKLEFGKPVGTISENGEVTFIP